MTVKEALAAGKTALAKAGIENPALDTALLLAFALGTNRSAVFVEAGSPGSVIAEKQFATFDGFIKRRAAGECVAYILGKKEFYGLDFTVNPCVLVPRPDTETLVEAALECLTNLEKTAGKKEPLRLLDLCTGSGAVAIAVKHRMPQTEVWATDISPDALETAKANAARLLPQNSGIRFLCGSLFDVFRNVVSPAFNIITANAPYIPAGEIPGLAAEVQGEPHIALDGGGDGLRVIEEIIVQAPAFLCNKGVLLLEAAPGQMPQIARMLERTGFAGIETKRDLAGLERVIAAENG